MGSFVGYSGGRFRPSAKEGVMAKRFFYVCAGLFLLALSWHLGAQSARAAFGGEPVGFQVGVSCSEAYVITADGDLYGRPFSSCGGPLSGVATFRGNFWDGATPVQRESLGRVKT